jgi:sigma-B regulation protein RsbU (phosphoserine phosphatase)
MGFEFQTKIGSLLGRVNRLLNKTFSDSHFVSLFYAELTDDKNGLVLYANCGHNNPILYRSGDKTTEFLEATGQMLGPFPDEVFRVENVLMNKADILLLYTDGISEATNEQGEEYGEDRIVQCIKRHAGRTPKEITQHLLEDVQAFNSLGTRSDDKTIVTIKRAG